MNTLKVAVISDLHCKHSSSGNDEDTWLKSDMMRRPINQHPVQSLINMLDNKNITADILLSPGDISDRSDPQGLVTGWSFLEEIKSKLKAKTLIASLGNHDVDSFGIYNKYDHLDMPRKLKNNYPFPFDIEKKSYIADKYCFIEFENTLIFNFNSVHSHTNKDSAGNAIITDEILESIQNELDNLNKEFKYKIALTHHHPIQHSNVGYTYKNSDFIEKGDKLLNILTQFDFQIFIHGHKHEPKITMYNDIPVFACGSFSSIRNLQETNSNNYFHIITLNENSKNGIIKNWEYTFGIGWNLSSSKLEGSIGFGYKGDLNELCQKVRNYYESKKIMRLEEKEFSKQFPEFNFLMPYERDKLINKLNSEYEFISDYSTGILKEIVKRKKDD